MESSAIMDMDWIGTMVVQSSGAGEDADRSGAGVETDRLRGVDVDRSGAAGDTDRSETVIAMDWSSADWSGIESGNSEAFVLTRALVEIGVEEQILLLFTFPFTTVCIARIAAVLTEVFARLRLHTSQLWIVLFDNNLIMLTMAL